MRREGARLGLAPSGRSKDTVVPAPDHSQDSVRERILGILAADSRSLTVRQVAAVAGASVDETAACLEDLCVAGLVRRFNTVIESYTTHFARAPR